MKPVRPVAPAGASFPVEGQTRTCLSVLRKMRWISGCIVLVIAGLAALSAELAPSDKWEKDIAAFEAQDAKAPPPKDSVLFVGSSSIRLWKLDESFPDLKAINRGFGGSEVADSVRYAQRIVLPHAPRIVVMYAGDNDIANGKSPEQVLSDFKEFVCIVRGALPETKIIYIGIKPSIKRWALIDKIRAANRLIREHITAQKNAKLVFLDIEPPMLGADGRPRADLLQNDGLHLNKRGYELWAELLREELDRP